ncbi:MAG: hypothetical protein CMM06_10705 [Rhodopirellula sp.]|nr:hypothetical protein [Rhodopirellula sp.]|tara:strand:+ start:4957 stop:5619 length:663 start_codon:yes stop_codon:yes gene_type:complete
MKTTFLLSLVLLTSSVLRADEFDLPVVTTENFNKGAANWEPKDPSAWKVVKQGDNSFYSMFKDSSYKPEVRSPVNFALLKEVTVSDFVLDVDMRSTQEVYGHQDLCLFFGYQDPSHFYYVHLGREADAHANSIFLVNGEPRVSIAQKRTDGTAWTKDWHHVRIKRDTSKGTIEVYFDDMKKPVMTTVDKHFLHGRIGIGSFDDTGDFDNLSLRGKLHKDK